MQSHEKDIRINKEKLQFELMVNGDLAYVEYRFSKGTMALMHTFVPTAARSQGIGSALAKFVLEYVKAQDLKIMVYCPLIGHYIKEHPEYEVLIDKQYRQL